ncbi:MAG: hypothetical protein ACOX7X_07455 [Methanosarcina flavescens]|uniref:Uncharacterized protein n=1 Tax=Methanosarcina flavescens TaxID=1715806 RepID=A0A660HUP5_9EURY|nr:hypothetical protein [Methanosarcina flavescens]AYK16003.1 hypothetical protein AOB57_013125 [Methanosarcina flavescens]NLK33341.1 hypothetical protein [Methanosarcina flavescens]
MEKDFTYIKFPEGTNKVYLDDFCYELDRNTDSLTISFEGYFSSFPERLAPCTIYIFGLGGVSILKMVAMLKSILLLFLLILEIILGRNSSLSSTLLFFMSLAFGIISSYISEIKNYYNISKCDKCGRDFAFKEIKEPLIKMVSTYDKFEKTITRYMKCIYCNNEEIKTEIEYELSKSKSKKISKNRRNCKECGKKLALAEYRHPDVNMEYRTVRTIKHYKCISCGYMEISIKYNYIPNSAD